MDPSSFSTSRSEPFRPSFSDFRRQASDYGWPFWRGVLIGFAAAFPIAVVAILGESFLGLAA